MKKYTNIHIFNRETYKISKHYSKIHEKVYKFQYNYSRNTQMFNKMHKKKYTNFHTTTQDTCKFSENYRILIHNIN